jgi:hypothetical protein
MILEKLACEICYDYYKIFNVTLICSFIKILCSNYMLYNKKKEGVNIKSKGSHRRLNHAESCVIFYKKNKIRDSMDDPFSYSVPCPLALGHMAKSKSSLKIT